MNIYQREQRVQLTDGGTALVWESRNNNSEYRVMPDGVHAGPMWITNDYITKAITPKEYNIMKQSPMFDLLEKTAKHLNLTKNENYSDGQRMWGNKKYFVYIGLFPIAHVAIDDWCSQNRLYSITSEKELLKIK